MATNLFRRISRVNNSVCELFRTRIYNSLSNKRSIQLKQQIHTKSSANRRLAVFGLLPTVGALGFGRKRSENKDPVVDKMAEGPSAEDQLFKEADDLFAQNHITKLYELLLPHKDTTNDDMLWRLARAARHMGKIAADKDDKKKHTYEAFEYVKRGLQINDKNFACHKWYAILLDYVGEYEGTKQRITNAYQVKEHLQKAIELSPKDATTIHSLGYWCFTVTDLPWYQRKVASMIFASPPTSTYEEALKYFLDAEKEDPNFYSMNLLMVGKTYLRLKDNTNAKVYLLKARDYVTVTEDDKMAHKEAVELLAGLGVKE